MKDAGRPSAPPTLPDSLTPPTTPLESPFDGAERSAGVELRAGDEVDRYVVEQPLGEGGAADVYRVRHRALGTLHALKVLRVVSADLLDRLLAEGRLQANLDHPNIVRVSDAFEVRGRPALLLEFVAGRSLSDLLDEDDEPLDTDEADRLFRGIVAGVAYAHSHDVVHRDLKPSNVLLAPRDGALEPRVTDFGIAKVLAGDPQGGRTRTGRFLGTPAYMAPEQIRETSAVDARADIFSLGVVLYEMVCGQRPFRGPDVLSLLNAVDRTDYPDPETLRPDLPIGILRAIRGCIVADPERRIPSCEVLLDVLDGAVWEADAASEEPAPRRAPPWLAPVAFGLTALGLAAAVGVVTHRSGERRVQAEASARLVAEQRGAIDALVSSAWRRADEQPAEALAILRAAAELAREAGLGPDATAEILDAQSVHDLRGAGGAVRVLPVPSQATSVSFRPAAGLLAAGSLDDRFLVWEWPSGRPLYEERADVGTPILNLQLSADGERLFLGPEWAPYKIETPKPIRVYETRTGRMTKTFANGTALSTFEISPDGSRAATWGMASTQLRIWDVDSGAPLLSATTTRQSASTCAAFSDDSTRLAWAEHGDLGLIDAATGAEIRRATVPHLGEDCRVAFLDEGRLLLVVGENGAQVQRTEDGEVVASDPRPGLGGYHLSLREESGLMASSANGATFSLRRLPSLEEVTVVSHDWRLSDLILSPDARTAASASFDGVIRLWSARTGKPRAELKGHRSSVLDLDWGEGDGLASAGRDGKVRIYAPPADVPRETVIADSVALAVIDHHGDVGYGGGPDGVRVVPLVPGAEARALPTRGPVSSVRSPRRYEAPVALAFSDDEATWVVERDGRVRRTAVQRMPRFLRLSDTGTVVTHSASLNSLRVAHPGDTELPAPRSTLGAGRGATFARGRDVFVMGMNGGGVTVVDVSRDDSEPRAVEAGSVGFPILVPLSERSVAAADWHGVIHIVDVDEAVVTATLEGHTDAVIGLDLSRDGTRLVSASWDRTVRVWDVATGRVEHVLKGHRGDAVVVAWSPDGRLVASGGKDGTVRLWDADSGRALRIFEVEAAPLQIRFGPESRHLHALGRDGVVRTWSVPDDPSAFDPVAASGEFTNLRLCRGTDRVVPVVPFPPPRSVWAPDEACAETP